jgi:TolB-like protein/Flp pilus assembly protein TadD
MFTDWVGFSASAQEDEASTLKLLQEEEELVRPIFASRHGREIKSTGDGFLVELDSALHAVLCAIEIQERLHDRNSRPGIAPIRLRIGVHLGDVEERGGDIFGDAVNIASRLEPLASPGGICISGQVYDQVRNKISNRLEKIEPRALKNIHVPIDVYRVTLPWEGGGSKPRDATRNRLAVLPLANISPDPKDEYFADGLTEELISALSKIQGLRVIARTSVSQYKSTSKSVSQISTELDVGSVLEGSVRKAGNRLRVTLQLIDASTQEHRWAKTYDRELDDVFMIQSEIAEKTAEAFRLDLLGTDRESIRKKPTSNLDAYNLYLQGLHAARQTTAAGYTDSRRFFEEAIARDPDFSLAYSALANMYLLMVGDLLAPGVAFPRASQLVTRALELDPESSDAHTARGNLALQHDQDWEISEIEFKRAISLNPSNANAHFWFAMLLTAVQRFDEAVEELRTTIELDPLWKLPRTWLLSVYFVDGNTDAALAIGEEERSRYPGDPSVPVALGTIYARAGRLEEARKEANRSLGPTDDGTRWNRAVLSARLGNPEEARALLAEWTGGSRGGYTNPALIAGLLSILGEQEQALEVLERDLLEGRSLWAEYQWMAFDSLRGHPRFRGILEKLNLPADAPGLAKTG